MRGIPGALERLAGDWNGTYSSSATGRRGSIRFALVAGEDHAHGDVVMSGASAYGHSGQDRDEYDHRSDRQTYFTIRFVQANTDAVHGALDPYWDSACRCVVQTTFIGRLSDDRIQGTFVSRFGDSLASGRWEVRRTRANPR